jgi:hypothetical protein
VIELTEYEVLPAERRPEMLCLWEGPAWGNIPFLEINHFRPEGSSHRPRTQCKLVYTEDGLYGIFRVEDRFVRAVRTTFQSEVYKDSCVEIFLQPKKDRGYFNFEFNCGGTMLASYITDPARVDGKVAAALPLTAHEAGEISLCHSLPSLVEEEITEATTWHLEFALPFTLFEGRIGALGTPDGTRWRANLYKCAGETSHPHWAAWSPVSALNFHAPHEFGFLHFGRAKGTKENGGRWEGNEMD